MASQPIQHFKLHRNNLQTTVRHTLTHTRMRCVFTTFQNRLQLDIYVKFRHLFCRHCYKEEVYYPKKWSSEFLTHSFNQNSRRNHHHFRCHWTLTYNLLLEFVRTYLHCEKFFPLINFARFYFGKRMPNFCSLKKFFNQSYLIQLVSTQSNMLIHDKWVPQYISSSILNKHVFLIFYWLSIEQSKNEKQFFSSIVLITYILTYIHFLFTKLFIFHIHFFVHFFWECCCTHQQWQKLYFFREGDFELKWIVYVIKYDINIQHTELHIGQKKCINRLSLSVCRHSSLSVITSTAIHT